MGITSMKFLPRKENAMSDKETKAAGDEATAEAVADGPVDVPEPKVEPRPVDPFADDTTDGKDGPAIHESYTVYDPTDDRPRLEDGPRSAPPLEDVPVDTGLVEE